MSDIRYGIIGTGMMGVEHIQNINAIDGATVTAIADTFEASRADGLAAAPGATVFDNHSELIDAGICDALVVATPNHNHIDILGDIMAADLPLMVEKPLCTTVEDCQRVLELNKARSAPVWVGLEYRYMPPIARLIQEIQNGTVGRVHMVAIREHRFPFLQKVDDWNRFSRNTGGTLVEKCCHYFDLMNLVIGSRPVRVYASGGQSVNHLDEIYDGERPDILDNAFVIADYQDGTRASLDLCMFAEATRNQEEVSVVGELGKVEAHIPDDIIRVGLRGKNFIGDVENQPVADDSIGYAGFHHGSSYIEHTRFIKMIRSGGTPEVTLEDGLWSVAVGAAAHLSIAEGRPISIDSLGNAI